MTTTTEELINLSNRLKTFDYKNGADAQEKLARYILYLHIFRMEFTTDEQLLKDSLHFVTLIFHHQDQRNQPTHLLIAECIDNEVNRRESRPSKGLKFPKFLQNNKNLDILIKYLEYLLTGEHKEEVLNDNTKKAEEIAKEQAYKLYLEELKYNFSHMNYKGDASK